MELLELIANRDISDAGAAKLLGCLGKLERLWLSGCNVSNGMGRKLWERGKEVRCNVVVLHSDHVLDDIKYDIIDNNATCTVN